MRITGKYITEKVVCINRSFFNDVVHLGISAQNGTYSIDIIKKGSTQRRLFIGAPREVDNYLDGIRDGMSLKEK